MSGSAATVTGRAIRVVERARQMGLSAEHRKPAVSICGRTLTVVQAEGYLDGWIDARQRQTGPRGRRGDG